MYEKRHRVFLYVCMGCWDSHRGGFLEIFYLAFLLKFDHAVGIWLKYEKSMQLTWRHTCLFDIILPWLAFQFEAHFIVCARRVEGKWRVTFGRRRLQPPLFTRHTHTHDTCDIPPFTTCLLWSTVDLFINWCLFEMESRASNTRMFGPSLESRHELIM
jgi:hypothetical protein